LSTQKKAIVPVFSCELTFLERLKRQEIDTMFTKLVSFIEENKQTMPAKTRFLKRRKQLIIDSTDFVLTLSFVKKIVFRIVINDPYRNKTRVNEIVNKIVSYINTFLGEKVMDARVFSSITFRSSKTDNLAKKLIGESKVAKICEFLQQTIEPIAVSFEYRIGEKDFYCSTITSEGRSTQLLGSHTVYKNKPPFNLVEKEIDELESPIGIIKRLMEMEAG